METNHSLVTLEPLSPEFMASAIFPSLHYEDTAELAVEFLVQTLGQYSLLPAVSKDGKRQKFPRQRYKNNNSVYIYCGRCMEIDEKFVILSGKIKEVDGRFAVEVGSVFFHDRDCHLTCREDKNDASHFHYRFGAVSPITRFPFQTVFSNSDLEFLKGANAGFPDRSHSSRSVIYSPKFPHMNFLHNASIDENKCFYRLIYYLSARLNLSEKISKFKPVALPEGSSKKSRNACQWPFRQDGDGVELYLSESYVENPEILVGGRSVCVVDRSEIRMYSRPFLLTNRQYMHFPCKSYWLESSAEHVQPFTTIVPLEEKISIYLWDPRNVFVIKKGEILVVFGDVPFGFCGRFFRTPRCLILSYSSSFFSEEPLQNFLLPFELEKEQRQKIDRMNESLCEKITIVLRKLCCLV